MKGWVITDEKQLNLLEITDQEADTLSAKIKITKSLITLNDLLRFRGEISARNIVLGSNSIGIVSETPANLFELEKGKRVYIDPYIECGKCYNCINNEGDECMNIQVAGDDFNGYLSDFAIVKNENLFPLPDGVSDLEALFIDKIALAIKVVDKLNIQKGDYVAVVGANNFGNILSQLLIYYSAVPILVTNNEEDYQIAKESGIYYVLNQEDNWQKEVSQITGGRMANKVVFVSDCDISPAKVFPLASFSADVVFTGVYYKNSPISFMQAIKKQLDIMCVNNGSGNTAAAINLISNKAIKLSPLKLNKSDFTSVPETLTKLDESFTKEEKIVETIIDYI